MAELAAEGVPVKQSCLALGVSRSGFYDARDRPPAARTIRQAFLTDQIAAVFEASRHTYGAPRVRAELVLGQGLVVSRKTVAVLMRRAGLYGLPLRRKGRRVPAAVTVTDLVKRDFHRDGPNQLWVTDITEHPTREGKLLLRGHRRLLPPSGRLGHRLPPTRRAGYLRARHGDRRLRPRRSDPRWRDPR
ncbi:IS3 family transposase [Frankia sp. Mgl5]|uniref:IS3 family transposase n=1 Tax=Frankia sp. Mgl5 TaxID=2933793 RepID=UPI00200F6D3B|nr:IS3 family transposase [Frankia sp. Mgl5]MCK9929681.1 IS3 family transposase [Frankia sp. Mgl5]